MVRPETPCGPSLVVCVSRFFQRFVFVLSVAIFVTLGLGFALGQFGWFGVHADDQQDGAYQQMRVYAEVLQKIQTDYVTDPNMSDVTTGALHGLLGSLDADSSYLTANEYKSYKDRPATGNAQEGITISKRFGYATVVNVAPQSPADQNHLADGDVIESIDGKSTHDLSLAVIRMMLEGKAGSTVDVTVIRPAHPDPDKLTLTRVMVPAPALSQQEYENSTILYIKPGVLTAALNALLGSRGGNWEILTASAFVTIVVGLTAAVVAPLILTSRQRNPAIGRWRSWGLPLACPGLLHAKPRFARLAIP